MLSVLAMEKVMVIQGRKITSADINLIKELLIDHPSNQVAKERGCPEPLDCSIALEGKSDQERFEALNWGLRTWDHWYFNDLDQRFGDSWPARHRLRLQARRASRERSSEASGS
jgi:hypothetical protein